MNNSPHYNLEVMKLVAMTQAKQHNTNYHIIISNPNPDGSFNPGISTYEMVTESYFNKARPEYKRLHTTDELIAELNVVTRDRVNKHFEDDGSYAE